MIRKILTGLAAALLTATVAASGCSSGGGHGKHPCFGSDPGSNGCHHDHGSNHQAV